MEDFVKNNYLQVSYLNAYVNIDDLDYYTDGYQMIDTNL